jgi:outer membrane protein assembly factor BamD
MPKSNGLLYILLSLFILIGCQSSEKIDTNTAEGAFKLAEKYEKDERFEESITYYNEVKNKYPYNRLAIEAKLRIADIEYSRENYVEAESAYKLFKEFHPDHPRTDYVTFRLGLSVYHQLPPTTDRDLKLATTAIEYFKQLRENHPQSKHLAEAKEYLKKCEQMQADKAYYVADFYFIRDIWQSALGRYEDLLKDYPGYGYDAKALYGATIAAYRMKDMDKAKSYFKRLLAEHPSSEELEKARKELADGF